MNCPFCGKPYSKFRDALSLKEYGISGMCQECQDGFFCDRLSGKDTCNKPCCKEEVE